MSTCTPIRGSYINVRDGAANATGTEWYNVTTTRGPTDGPSTTTISSWTSFSTANATFTKLVDEDQGFGRTTITPVYALGDPVPVESVTTIRDMRRTYTHLTAPLPSQCIYTYLKSDPSDCGQCHISGGTVDLYFWPPNTAPPPRGAPPSTTMLNGTTLVSPTAYIYLSTISARNACSDVGEKHTGTLFAIDPTELSTQLHVGGKVAAYKYAQIDYHDLTGLPPPYEYEMQPSCYMFGCETIYSTQWHPTLKVPPQVRSIDPAWADCGLALEGLYDPPVALQPRAAAASPTGPTDPETTSPLPSMTWKPVTSTAVHQPDSSPDPPEKTASKKSTAYASVPAEDESTSTLVLTSHIATTRVVTIDTPEDVETEQSSPPIGKGNPSPQVDQSPPGQSTGVVETPASSPGDPRPHGDGSPTAMSTTSDAIEVPNSILTPAPLPNGDGVVLSSQTLEPGEVLTIGTGRTKTTLSLHTEADSETWLVYGTSAMVAVHPPESKTPQLVSRISGYGIYHLGGVEYQIGTHTLGPGSTATVGRGDDRMTYHMYTQGSRILLALGTTRTLNLFTVPASGASLDETSSSDAGLAFTQASDGNFVLHGTTLLPGESVTIGTGRERTTLAITSLQSVPAIVIDGTATQKLTHPPIPSTSGTSLPAITEIPPDTIVPLPSIPASTSSEDSNGAGVSRPSFGVLVAGILVIAAWNGS